LVNDYYGVSEMRVLLTTLLLLAAVAVLGSAGDQAQAGSNCNPNVQAC
jgi:hypothetical protein